MFSDLVELPVCVRSKRLRACSHALDLGDEKAYAVGEPRVALESLLSLVLSQKLVQILLVGHSGWFVLRYVLHTLYSSSFFPNRCTRVAGR